MLGIVFCRLRRPSRKRFQGHPQLHRPRRGTIHGQRPQGRLQAGLAGQSQRHAQLHSQRRGMIHGQSPQSLRQRSVQAGRVEQLHGVRRGTIHGQCPQSLRHRSLQAGRVEQQHRVRRGTIHGQCPQSLSLQAGPRPRVAAPTACTAPQTAPWDDPWAEPAESETRQPPSRPRGAAPTPCTAPQTAPWDEPWAEPTTSAPRAAQAPKVPEATSAQPPGLEPLHVPPIVPESPWARAFAPHIFAPIDSAKPYEAGIDLSCFGGHPQEVGAAAPAETSAETASGLQQPQCVETAAAGPSVQAAPGPRGYKGFCPPVPEEPHFAWAPGLSRVTFLLEKPR